MKKNVNSQSFIPDLCSVQSVFILVLIAELVVIVLTLSASKLPNFDWNHLGLGSSLALWIILVSAACLCRLRAKLNQLPLVKAAIISFSLILFVGTAFCILGEWLLYYASGDYLYQTSLFNSLKQLDYWHALNNILIVAIVSGISLRYFYVQEQLRQRKQAELEARLAALQARIRPHFLFNSLNSVASLIVSDPHKAEDMVLHLCDLFRAALSDSDKPHSLEQELELCHSYLQIEQIRLGERLNLEWHVDFQKGPIPQIPKLLIQPLVENAVYHGIQPMEQGGTITVEAKSDPEDSQQMIVTISNPLPKPSPDVPQGHQIALGNIRSRLQGYFANRANISISSGECYTVKLSLPVVLN